MATNINSFQNTKRCDGEASLPFSKTQIQSQSQNPFPFHFNPDACHHCSARCCRGGSGNIWVTPDEMQRIIAHTGENPVDAIHQLFERREGRFSIKERCVGHGDGENNGREFRCIFLDERFQCTIYPVRPAQCRSFPFWDYYRSDERLNALLNECPGVRKRLEKHHFMSPHGSGENR